MSAATIERPGECKTDADAADTARKHIDHVVSLVESARAQVTENEYPYRALGIVVELACGVMHGQADVFDMLAVLTAVHALVVDQPAVSDTLRRAVEAGEAAADALEHVDRVALVGAPKPAPGFVHVFDDPDEPYYLAGQTADILAMLADNIEERPLLGSLCDIAEKYAAQLRDAADKDESFEAASSTAQGLLDLMDKLDADKLGGGVFYGAQNLLTMSKRWIDAKRNQLATQQTEAAHA